MEKLKGEIDETMGKVHKGIMEARKVARSVVGGQTRGLANSAATLSLSAVRDIEKLSQKKGKNTADERFKVVPDYAYPNTRMNREDLRLEMNKKSAFFHDLRLPSEEKGVGQIAVEILQCFGIPKSDLLKETSAFCVGVCGPHAFKTDVMPPVANPMWLSKMRRACIFPVHEAYTRLYIGVFGAGEKKDGFAGRVVIHLSRLRPNCTYDVSLPLRRFAHVFSREQRGAIRFRVHLQWFSERKALTSYFPRGMPKVEPNERVVVPCCDAKAFQNVARVVHGDDMPGRFSIKRMQAAIREINFTRIHVLRYLRKREFRNICLWENKIISGFVFVAWMHCVYTASVTYIPGHLLTLLLLYLWKNYANYAMESPVQNGFLQPSWEELFLSLLLGNEGQSYIQPLEMEMKDEMKVKCATQDMSGGSMTTISEEFAYSISEVAQAFRAGVRVQRMRRGVRAFKGSDAVNFLLNAGYVESRDDAVVLGCRLAKELKLFEHVEKKHVFRDDNSAYVFLEYDLNTYAMKTHRPWGKSLFRLLGFSPQKELTESESHIEMPYSDGNSVPRLTVKESLVIRSKESRKLLSEESSEMESEIKPGGDSSQQLISGIDVLLDEENDQIEIIPEERDSFTICPSSKGADLEVKILKKPPEQDIDIKKKPDKKLPAVLAEARHKMHAALLHLFNDRVYAISQEDNRVINRDLGSKRRLAKAISSRKNGKVRSPLSSDRGSNTLATSNIADVKTVEEEYNRLLGTEKYSQGNPLITKIGVVVQPIVEMALGWLCLFRALFNIFTWRDPFLSFWISIFGPLVVIVLHLLPWRFMMGVLGIVLVGPQNWVLRVLQERREGWEPYDPDKIVKKKKNPKERKKVNSGELPLFSMYTPDNFPVSNTEIDSSNIREVLVPDSQLMYNRFYDWPPENEYARVKAEEAPISNRSYLSLMKSVSFDDSVKSNGSRGTLGRTLSNRLRRRRKYGRETDQEAA